MTGLIDAKPWLSIVGLGEDGLDGLSAPALALIEQAQVLVGGERHLAMVPDDGRERLTWTTPLLQLVDQILARRGEQVCILATGDPMDFGIGVTFARRLPMEEMVVLPALSAFSLAAARLGWSLSNVDCLTLHGRPLALLAPSLLPDNKLLVLSHGPETPAEVSRYLCEQGYGGSEVTVLEHMGGPKERRVEARAETWPQDQVVAALNTLAVTCRAGPGARLLPPLPGLPDETFRHDGQLTKSEVRAATLAKLRPTPGQHLWDIGAGCGSIAIEWMRAARGATAQAVESEPSRLAMMAENAQALGTPGLKTIAGRAPDALAVLSAPDAIFVGGGISEEGLLERCWSALRPGGRMVANVVTLEGEARLFEAQGRWGGELCRISVSRAEPVGRFQGWRPMMPVTQWSVQKDWGSVQEDRG